jgi:indolepyruvate ferredoxin oxidoreductase
MGDAIATNMFMLGYAWQHGWVPLSEAAVLKSIELNGVSVDFNQQSFAWGRLAAHDLAAVEKELKVLAPAQVIEFKRAPTLEDLITRRSDFLTAYQHAAYAQTYRAFVDQVRAAESKIVAASQPLRLTEAVARYLFKLMAYKDEYEVARLHSDPAFKAKIAGMFEGDIAIKYHLAPPLLSKRDREGHLIKREFGSWVGKVFPLLASLRFLRGSLLDPFGHTEERKGERALIVRYQQTIAGLLPSLSTENLAQVVAVASIPEDIRGYGHVKERHVLAATQKEAGILSALKVGATGGKTDGRHAA